MIEPRDTLEIYGTKGSIHIPVLNKGEITIVVDGETHSESHPSAENTHMPMIEEFATAVQNRVSPAIDGDTGRLVAVVIDQIYTKGDREKVLINHGR